MPTVIKGQPTSSEVIDHLKAENKPVLLAFSCGKDSLATWCALKDAGIEVIPAYMWTIPHMKFVDAEIEHYENLFGVEIKQYPHPSFWRLINRCALQPPARLRAIATLGLIEPTYEETWSAIKDDLGLAQDTWVADGVRAADSIVRRASFVRNGVMKRSTHKVSPIADMLKAELIDLLDSHDVDLPVDYEIWGRSFDGFDCRFSRPLKEHMPDDYELAKKWFPLLDAEIYRERYVAAAVSESQSNIERGDSTEYAMRNKAEAKRRSVSTDGASIMRVCFATAEDCRKFESLVRCDDDIVPYELVESAFRPVCDGLRAQRVAEPRLGRLGISPLDTIEETGDLSADSYLEAETCLMAMESADKCPSGRAYTDTSIYKSVVFPSHDHLESFCRTRRVMRFGMMYVDGSSWMKTI